MQKTAHFRVDPKLAHVLGESYTSSEKALKDKPARRGLAGARIKVPLPLDFTNSIIKQESRV
jgi:hypothetical protein